MHVGFLLNTFPKLSETFILDQITGLIDLGHQVSIIAQKGGESLHHPNVERYSLLERVRYYALPPTPQQRLLKALRILLRDGPRHPQPILQALLRLKGEGYKLLFASSALLDLPDLDVLLCHFGPLGQLGITLKEIGATPASVACVFHGYDITSHPQTHGQHIYDKLFAQGDLMLPISERWRRKLVDDFHAPADKVRVHHMGIDPALFDLVPRTRAPQDPFRILSVARLEEKKGLRYAIEAIAALPDDISLVYHIIGDGKLRAELEALIKTHDLTDRVHLLGWKQRHEVRDMMQAAHLMLAPSVTASNGDMEGIPMVLMEALATGLPVLSTLHSGIPELVQDPACGRLVPEKDVAALTAALQELLHLSQEQHLAMGKAGRSIVDDEFNIHKLNQQLAHTLSS